MSIAYGVHTKSKKRLIAVVEKIVFSMFDVVLGPVTVPMVSTNSSPPIAMPVQVPPGHVVQQIVDESGTLRHVILSTQHPAGLVPLPSHNPPHYVSQQHFITGSSFTTPPHPAL